MSKPSTAAHAPLNKSFLTHREYIEEAMTLADLKKWISARTDSFIILANPYAQGLGWQVQRLQRSVHME
jgi:hypothetical protein